MLSFIRQHVMLMFCLLPRILPLSVTNCYLNAFNAKWFRATDSFIWVCSFCVATNLINKLLRRPIERGSPNTLITFWLYVCVYFFCYAVSQPRRWNLDVLKFDEHLANVAHDSIYSAYASLFVMAQTQRNVVFIVVAKHNSVDIFKLNGKKDFRNRRQDKNNSGDQESNVFVRLFAARFCQQPTQRQRKQAKLSFEEISNKSYSINVVIKSSICYQIWCALITMISFCIQ